MEKSYQLESTGIVEQRIGEDLMDEQRNELQQEVDRLIQVLDEDLDWFVERIGHIQKGNMRQVRFIDSHIRPVVHIKLRHQINKVLELSGGVNE